MKTIKDTKSVGTRTFVHLMVVMLLLSSMIGITVWAEKPEEPPGKPDNPGKTVETWDLQIYIGIKDSEGNPIEDIVLMDPDYLSAEDVPCSAGLWNIPDPEAKGNGRKDRYVSAQLSFVTALGDDCGTYTMNPVEGKNSYNEEPVWLDQVIPDNTQYYLGEVDIGHQKNPLEQDYWWFRLIWSPEIPSPGEWSCYQFYAWTDKSSDGEVMPPEGDELVITFENEDAVFTGDMPGPLDVPENYEWLGKVSFTITIIREPHVA